MSAFAWSAHFNSVQIPELRTATLDTQIDVYADRVRVWQLSMAEALAGVEHSGFAILAILAGYFESTAKFRAGYTGNGDSAKFFARGVRTVLTPLLKPPLVLIPEPIVTLLYKEVRNGMYHEMITGPRVVLQRMDGAIIAWDLLVGEVRALHIDPVALTAALRRDFDDYILQLKDPNNTELRTAFAARFNRSVKTPPPRAAR